MNSLKLLIVLLNAVYFDFTFGVKLNCDVQNNWDYQELFQYLGITLGPGIGVCDFKDDNNRSLNLEIDLKFL
jgi:hypothetical protein